MKKQKFDRLLLASFLCFILGISLIICDIKQGLVFVWLAYMILAVKILDAITTKPIKK